MLETEESMMKKSIFGGSMVCRFHEPLTSHWTLELHSSKVIFSKRASLNESQWSSSVKELFITYPQHHRRLDAASDWGHPRCHTLFQDCCKLVFGGHVTSRSFHSDSIISQSLDQAENSCFPQALSHLQEGKRMRKIVLDIHEDASVLVRSLLLPFLLC
jgi:hypothetical protein